MNRRNGDEHGGIVNSVCDDATDRSLDVPMVVHIGVVQSDLPPSPKTCSRVGLALDEDVDDLAIEIVGIGAFGKVETRRTDRPVDTFPIKSVIHDVVTDVVAAAGAANVADDDRLGLVEFDTRRAGRNRGEQAQVMPDLLGRRHLDLSKRHGDAEAGGAVRDVHRLEGILGVDRVATSLRVVDGVHDEQWRLGLYVVNVGRIVDPCCLHRTENALGDLCHHGGPADVLGEDDIAHRVADGETRLIGDRTVVLDVGEDGGMGAQDAIGATGPHHRNLVDLFNGPRALLHQNLAEGLIGDDPGEVVDTTVSLGLADDGDDAIRGEDAFINKSCQTRCVPDALEHNLAYLNGHYYASCTKPVRMTRRYSNLPKLALGYVALSAPTSLSHSYEGESLTLQEVLATPSFQETEVLAGASGLERIVSSVNVMENPDITPWVKSRELLITVGYSLAGHGKELAVLVEDLADLGLAGFGVKLGPYVAEVSADALDAANRRDFPILSLPPTVSFDDLIADVYRARDSLLLGGLHLRSDREHELISVSLEGGGPSEVAARLAQLVSCEVVVLGPNNDVLSHHSAGGRTPPEDRDPRESARFEEAVTAPIVFGSTYVGQLYVLPNAGPSEEFSPGLVPRCAQIMALAASREIAVSSVDRQFRAELLEQVLRNRLDRREVGRRCQALDWTISYPAVVVSLSPTELDATSHLERTRDALGWSLRARGLHAPHAIINGNIVAIVGKENRVVADPEATAAEATSEVISRSVAGTWSAGVSGRIDGPSDLLRGWDQARTATGVTRAIKGVGAVGRFTELGVFRLLSEVDPNLLREFAKEALGELYEPSEGRAELRRTLAVLLDTNLNVAKTARELHYHYNSVRYRISQLEQLVGPFLTDSTRRLELHVALLISDMVPGGRD